MYLNCFWYYGILTLIAIFVSWVFILIGYKWPEDNCVNMWEYYIPGIIPYLIWSGTVLLFMYGAYHADCRDIPGQRTIIYRTLYFFVIFLDILAILSWLIFHAPIPAIILYVISLLLLITLIILFSEIDVNDSWFSFPYMLVFCYSICLLGYYIRHKEFQTHY